jgi:hypothetical protein
MRPASAIAGADVAAGDRARPPPGADASISNTGILRLDDGRYVCPARECGRVLKQRGLLRHASAGSCTGGLTAAQMQVMRSLSTMGDHTYKRDLKMRHQNGTFRRSMRARDTDCCDHPTDAPDASSRLGQASSPQVIASGVTGNNGTSCPSDEAAAPSRPGGPPIGHQRQADEPCSESLPVQSSKRSAGRSVSEARGPSVFENALIFRRASELETVAGAVSSVAHTRRADSRIRNHDELEGGRALPQQDTVVLPLETGTGPPLCEKLVSRLELPKHCILGVCTCKHCIALRRPKALENFSDDVEVETYGRNGVVQHNSATSALVGSKQSANLTARKNVAEIAGMGSKEAKGSESREGDPDPDPIPMRLSLNVRAEYVAEEEFELGERHRKRGTGVGSFGNAKSITVARDNDAQICTRDEIRRNESGAADNSAVDALAVPSCASIQRPTVGGSEVTPAPTRSRVASGTRTAHHRGSVPNSCSHVTSQNCISTAHAQPSLPPRKRRSCLMPQQGIDRRLEGYAHETGENVFECFNSPETAPINVHGQSGHPFEPPQLCAHDHQRFIRKQVGTGNLNSSERPRKRHRRHDPYFSVPPSIFATPGRPALPICNVSTSTVFDQVLVGDSSNEFQTRLAARVAEICLQVLHGPRISEDGVCCRVGIETEPTKLEKVGVTIPKCPGATLLRDRPESPCAVSE